MTIVQEILSDPNFEPPEDLFKLNLNGGLDDLILSSKLPIKLLIGLAIEEAELVLPAFYALYPDDPRPREVILNMYKYLEQGRILGPTFNDSMFCIIDEIIRKKHKNIKRLGVTRSGAEAMDRAAHAVRVVHWIATAVTEIGRHNALTAISIAMYQARLVDPSITEKHQILKFFNLYKGIMA